MMAVFVGFLSAVVESEFEFKFIFLNILPDTFDVNVRATGKTKPKTIHITSLIAQLETLVP